MRSFILSVLLGGLIISGYAQVADNVEEATRFSVSQDNIIAVPETHNYNSSEINLNDAINVDFRSSSQLEELGSRYGRSEEHTSELQSHSFISYAVFCLKKKKKKNKRQKKKREKKKKKSGDE